MKTYSEYISNCSTEVDDGVTINGLCNLKIDESDSRANARLADYSYILLLIDKLAARSYSLIEACVSDKDQQKAFKKTLKGIVDEQRDKAYRELVLGQ